MDLAYRLRLVWLALAVLAGSSSSSWAQGLDTALADDEPNVPWPTVEPITAGVARTWLKLQQPITMPFEKETPLGDVLKYIKEKTSDKSLPGGLTFYIAPNELEENEKSMSTPISLNLTGLPLASSLKLILNQIGMHFIVQEDGIVEVRAKGCSDGEPIRPTLTAPEARTWLRLHQPVDIPFEADTPLRDVVKFLNAATQIKGDGEEPGLQIHVESYALRDKQIGMDSTVRLKLAGYPLRTGLKLMLAQLGLKFRVEDDGLLVIGLEDWDVKAATPLVEDAKSGAQEMTILELRKEARELREELAALKGQDTKPGAAQSKPGAKAPAPNPSKPGGFR